MFKELSIHHGNLMMSAIRYSINTEIRIHRSQYLFPNVGIHSYEKRGNVEDGAARNVHYNS